MVNIETSASLDVNRKSVQELKKMYIVSYIKIKCNNISKCKLSLLFPRSYLKVQPYKNQTFSSLAFIATIIVLKDINTAPTAGLRIIPSEYKTPAASGIAKAL
jgi:hypothetical protein